MFFYYHAHIISPASTALTSHRLGLDGCLILAFQDDIPCLPMTRHCYNISC